MKACGYQKKEYEFYLLNNIRLYTIVNFLNCKGTKNNTLALICLCLKNIFLLVFWYMLFFSLLSYAKKSYTLA